MKRKKAMRRIQRSVKPRFPLDAPPPQYGDPIAESVEVIERVVEERRFVEAGGTERLADVGVPAGGTER